MFALLPSEQMQFRCLEPAPRRLFFAAPKLAKKKTSTMELFADVCYHLCQESFDERDRILLEHCLTLYGARKYDANQHESMTHIICHTSRYATHEQWYHSHLIPIVLPEWVYHSTLRQSIQCEQKFKADPTWFLAAKAFFLANTIHASDRAIYQTLIEHYGGSLTQDSLGCTHFISSIGNDPQVQLARKRQRLAMDYRREAQERSLDQLRVAIEEDKRTTSASLELPQWLLEELANKCRIGEYAILDCKWLSASIRHRMFLDPTPYLWSVLEAESSESQDQDEWMNVLRRLQHNIQQIDPDSTTETSFVDQTELSFTNTSS